MVASADITTAQDFRFNPLIPNPCEYVSKVSDAKHLPTKLLALKPPQGKYNWETKIENVAIAQANPPDNPCGYATLMLYLELPDVISRMYDPEECRMLYSAHDWGDSSNVGTGHSPGVPIEFLYVGKSPDNFARPGFYAPSFKWDNSGQNGHGVALVSFVNQNSKKSRSVSVTLQCK